MRLKTLHREEPQHVFQPNRRSQRQAQWRAVLPASWRGDMASAAFVPWLADAGSLTLRLQRVWGECRVRRVVQGVGSALPEEATLLATAIGDRVLRREVVLSARGVARVFARSVVLRHRLKRDWPFWNGLGQRSLGARLFSDAGVHRAAMWFARLQAAHPLAQRVRAELPQSIAADAVLYARYSLFTRGGGAMLVAEVFLPAVVEAQPAEAQAVESMR